MATTTWRECVFAAVLATGFSQPAAAQSPSSELRQLISIRPDTVSKVLDELAERTGRTISFDRAAFSKLQSPGVHGKVTLKEALEQALQEASASARFDGDRIVVSATTSAPSTKAGTAEDPAELSRVVVNGVSTYSATRTDTSVKDIPQSIEVMGAKQLEAQNSFSLSDALNRAAGISILNVGANQPVYGARGFRITNAHVDGGAAVNVLSGINNQAVGVADMGEYDHIEILRGADALFGGSGNPGASFSLIRKDPLRTRETSLTLSGGSWNNFRSELDVSAPLNEEGTLRARADVVALSNDAFYKGAYNRLQKAYAVLAYDLTDTTTLTFGASYAHQKSNDVTGGLPLYPNGTDAHLPQSLALIFPWTYLEKDSKEAFVKFTQEIGDRWFLKGGITYLGSSASDAYAQFVDPLDPLTNAIAGFPNVSFTKSPTTTRQLAMDLTLTGSWNFFDFPMDTMLGIDHQDYHGSQLSGYIQSYSYSTGNLFNFDPTTLKDPRTDPNAQIIGGVDLEHQRTTGVYGTLRMHVTNSLAVVAGGRWNDLHSKTITLATFGPYSFDQSLPPSADKKFTPFAGITYSLAPDTSLYLSYADIYSPNYGKLDRNLQGIPPVEGVNSEIGVKKQWNDGKLVGTFAIYSIRQNHNPYPDLTASNPTGNPNCCYVATLSNKSKGVEMQLSGQIQPGWDFSAGYTYNNNKADYGNVLGTFTPRHLVKLWTDYRLPGAWNKLSFGGNLLLQSSNYTSGTYYSGKYCAVTGPLCVADVYTFKDQQGGYAIVDLRVAYALSKNISTSLSLNNVADRRYYTVIGAPWAGTTYGAPRNFLVRFESKF